MAVTLDNLLNSGTISWDGGSITATSPGTWNFVGLTVGGYAVVDSTRAFTCTAPLTIDGGATADLSADRTFAMTQANGSTNGYLTSTDWSRFDTTATEVAAGIPVTITTAALTPLGAQGSMTFVSGVLVSQVQAT